MLDYNGQIFITDTGDSTCSQFSPGTTTWVFTFCLLVFPDCFYTGKHSGGLLASKFSFCFGLKQGKNTDQFTSTTFVETLFITLWTGCFKAFQKQLASRKSFFEKTSLPPFRHDQHKLTWKFLFSKETLWHYKVLQQNLELFSRWTSQLERNDSLKSDFQLHNAKVMRDFSIKEKNFNPQTGSVTGRIRSMADAGRGIKGGHVFFLKTIWSGADFMNIYDEVYLWSN